MNKVSITERVGDLETIRSIESTEPIHNLIRHLNDWEPNPQAKEPRIFDSPSIKEYRILEDAEYFINGDEYWDMFTSEWVEVNFDKDKKEGHNDFIEKGESDYTVGEYKKTFNENAKYRRKV